MRRTRRNSRPTGYMVLLAFVHLPFILAAIYVISVIAKVGLFGLEWGTFGKAAGFTLAAGYLVYHIEKFVGLDIDNDRVKNATLKLLFRGFLPAGTAMAGLYGDFAAWWLGAAAIVIGEYVIAQEDKKR